MKILIADDHAVVRRGVKQILEAAFPGVTFGEAEDAAGALQQIRNQAWDIVVLDITMPGRNGLEVLRAAKSSHPHLPILVLSMHPEDQYAVRTLQAGADGYLTKETAPEELVHAIRRILDGGQYVSPALAQVLAVRLRSGHTGAPHEALSDREDQVMRLLAGGRTVTRIAEELSLSVKTISTYRARILQKMGMKTTAELMRYAIDSNLVE